MSAWPGTSYIVCPRCGTSHGLTTSHQCATTPVNTWPPAEQPEIKHGWQCPVCGTVYAPHVAACFKQHPARLLPQEGQPEKGAD